MVSIVGPALFGKRVPFSPRLGSISSIIRLPLDVACKLEMRGVRDGECFDATSYVGVRILVARKPSAPRPLTFLKLKLPALSSGSCSGPTYIVVFRWFPPPIRRVAVGCDPDKAVGVFCVSGILQALKIIRGSSTAWLASARRLRFEGVVRLRAGRPVQSATRLLKGDHMPWSPYPSRRIVETAIREALQGADVKVNVGDRPGPKRGRLPCWDLKDSLIWQPVVLMGICDSGCHC
ncbi:hypothetical protein FB107DRAFT_272291 [Schizophyllum commune]